MKSGPTPTPGSSNEARRAYTVRLSAAESDQFDEYVMAVRKSTRRRVDKSELFRAFIQMLGDDQGLLDEVSRRVAADV